MKQRYFILAIWLLACPCTLYAQVSATLDSLTTYLRTHAPTDTTYGRVTDKAVYELIYIKQTTPAPTR